VNLTISRHNMRGDKVKLDRDEGREEERFRLDDKGVFRQRGFSVE